MKKVLAVILLFSSASIFGQERTVNEILLSGNDYYRKSQFAKASEEYGKVLNADPSNITAGFNQSNALYKQDKKVEASVLLSSIASTVTDKSILAKIHYNKGVILTRQKNLEESIEAYKNALRNDPSDKDARENLQKALLELKKKNEDKKKEKEQDKKKQDNKKQPQPKMKPKEAEQRLKLLQQKEKETQQRVQKEKTRTGGSKQKDW